MNPETLTEWAEAETLVDLGHLTAEHLEDLAGNVLADDHPRQFAGRAGLADGPDNVIPTLIDLNRAGFVTLDFMVGAPWSTDLPAIERRAAVQGFCDTVTMEWLTMALHGTRYQAIVVTSSAGPWTGDLNRGVPVVRHVNGAARTTFGRQYTATEIGGSLFDGVLNRTATWALALAWNVTIFDLCWGSNDLWQTLARAADPELLELAAEHLRALPAA